MRDNARPMSLADLISERLQITGQTANAASVRAGLNRDYLGDLLELFADKEVPDPNPRRDTLIKLAKGLECTVEHLMKDGASQSSEEAEFLYLIRAFPDNERPRAKAVLEALLQSLKPESEVLPPKKARK